MEALNIILGGQVGALPTPYLGMPLGAKSMSKVIWGSVIVKCEKKLARWKGQCLSLGGRVTLINTVLDVIVGTCNHCKLYIEYRSVVQWKRVYLGE